VEGTDQFHVDSCDDGYQGSVRVHESDDRSNERIVYIGEFGLEDL
jgi:hypothetical protein